MNHKTFEELLVSYESALNTLGLGYAGRLRCLCQANTIIKKHETKGLTWFDDETIAAYLQGADQDFYEGKMKKQTYSQTIRNTRRFLHFCEFGTIDDSNPLEGSRRAITPEFGRIADEYLASGNFHPNTRNDMRWATHKYFSWLAAHGHDDMSETGANEIQHFLLDCAEKHPPSSVYTIRLHLKKLYAFLYESNLSPSAYTELLSFNINRESKIFPALPMSDIAKLLESIDRETKVGKRAYAAMILGAELGLRACDVANMKLSDIDWVCGEIKILQLKTRKTVVLPLTHKVGEALRDYILHARPKTKERHIFLRSIKPYTPLKAAASIGEIYRDCCKAAELPISKSFHTLRRSLATAMVTNGVKVTDVAQILGDDLVESTKKYISLDSVHLKRCALTFDGIAPGMIGGDV